MLVTLMTLALVGGAATAAEPTCEGEVALPGFRSDLKQAYDAYERADTEALAAAVLRFEAALPCAAAPLPSDVVARYHRLSGLSSFLQGQRDVSQQHFEAARALAPDFSFDESLLPKKHPVRVTYEAADPSHAPRTALPELPEGYSVWVDGQPGAARVQAWPQVFQHQGEQQPLSTSLLAAGAPMPELQAPTSGRSGAKLGLWVGAGAAAAVTGLAVGMSAARGGQYDATMLAATDTDGGLQELYERGVAQRNGAGRWAGVAVGGAAATAGLTGLALTVDW